MNREQMIEAAATAMREAERYPSEPGQKSAAEFARESYRKLARVALAVFEQSSAPTGQDDREALLNDLVIRLNNEAYGKDDKTWGNVMRQIQGVEMARAALRTPAESPEPPSDTERELLMRTMENDARTAWSLYRSEQRRANEQEAGRDAAEAKLARIAELLAQWQVVYPQIEDILNEKEAD